MNNNYVPEWHTTPFEHMRYTLVRNQDQLDILFDSVKAPFEFLESGADARVTFNDDHAIVQIKDCDWWEYVKPNTRPFTSRGCAYLARAKRKNGRRKPKCRV